MYTAAAAAAKYYPRVLVAHEASLIGFLRLFAILWGSRYPGAPMVKGAVPIFIRILGLINVHRVDSSLFCCCFLEISIFAYDFPALTCLHDCCSPL